jgi:hypothetical protein
VLRFVIAALIVALLVRMVIGAVRGQLRTRSRCSVADPRRDLRRRSALPDQPPGDR